MYIRFLASAEGRNCSEESVFLRDFLDFGKFGIIRLILRTLTSDSGSTSFVSYRSHQNITLQSKC